MLLAPSWAIDMKRSCRHPRAAVRQQDAIEPLGDAANFALNILDLARQPVFDLDQIAIGNKFDALWPGSVPGGCGKRHPGFAPPAGTGQIERFRRSSGPPRRLGEHLNRLLGRRKIEIVPFRIDRFARLHKLEVWREESAQVFLVLELVAVRIVSSRDEDGRSCRSFTIPGFAAWDHPWTR
jgi:hypothetical protein